MRRAILTSLQKIKTANPVGVWSVVKVENIGLLIRLGLVAGDHSRPYVTDKGDLYLKRGKL